VPFISDPLRFVVSTLYLLPAILVGLVLHELAHAYVAVARGDPTPRLDGRLSLNPARHLDPLGTIMLILFRFGYARPVRVNPLRLRGPFDMALVALAGPLANLLIAVIVSFPLKILIAQRQLPGCFEALGGARVCIPSLSSDPLTILVHLLVGIFYLNIVLMVFNLLPIPPLDGYNLVKALAGPGSRAFFIRLERQLQIVYAVLLIALFLGGAGLLFRYVITPIYVALATLLLSQPVYLYL
jgi:Zn-dependent protease